MVTLATVRNRLQIQPNYNRLAQMGFPEEKALTFASGAQGLLGHHTILSESGIILHTRVQALLASDLPASNDNLANQFDEMLPQLPSVAAPHLSLFVSPSSMLTEDQKQAVIAMFTDNKYGYKILAITDGCANQCFACANDSPPHMRHMPYPMIAAITNDILSAAAQRSGKLKITPYYRSDPMHYRDVHFNADFSDVAVLFRSAGIEYDFVSHGWWKGDRYAQQAAEALSRADISANALSVNLFHKQLADYPLKVNDFIERFQTAIRLLRPKEVRLLGELSKPGSGRPKMFSRGYLSLLFHKVIARDYPGKVTHVIGPYYEGRATAVPHANDDYHRVSIMRYPNNVMMGHDGRIMEVHTRARIKGEKGIGEIFSGADDFGFIALMYHWMLDVKDELRGGNLDCLLSEVDGSSYLKAFNEFSRIIQQKGGPSVFKYGDLSPEDLHGLFDKLKDLPLVLPENISFFTFERFLSNYWEKIKDKYPQFDHDFYSFFEECLKLSPIMSKILVNDKLHRYSSCNLIYLGILDEEDWRTIADHFKDDHFEGDILESVGFYRYLEQYAGKHVTNKLSPEEVRHLYSLLKNCPTFDREALEYNEEFDCFSFPPMKLKYYEKEEEELPYRLFPV